MQQGVRLCVFEDVLAYLPRDSTTKEVCEHVKVATSENRQSYREALDPDMVANAIVFVSHAWSYKFSAVIDALKCHFFQTPEIGVWIDIFCHNQHLSSDFAQIRDAFRSVLQECDRIVVVLSPWEDPLVFTRAWCLFEMFTMIQARRKIELVLPPTELERFLNTFGDKHTLFDDMVEKVDVARSEATNQNDKRQLLEIMDEAEGGHAEVNKQIITNWCSLIVELFRKHVDQAEREGNLSQKTKRVMAVLYYKIGDDKNAEDWFARAMVAPRENSPIEAVLCLQYLATIREMEQRVEGDNVRLGEQQAGEANDQNRDDLASLSALHRLAVLRWYQGNFKEAAAHLEECFLKRTRILGKDHHDTICTRAEYIKCLTKLDDLVKLQEAVGLLRTSGQASDLLLVEQQITALRSRLNIFDRESD
eukprot:c9463_g1_i2.p1 GENE.c9463_g1_i2~~c9463_g1_i2.p1  ORF type:complete len:420 (+),score=78.64 c9463_g1_i2:84-1343(+)